MPIRGPGQKPTINTGTTGTQGAGTAIETTQAKGSDEAKEVEKPKLNLTLPKDEFGDFGGGSTAAERAVNLRMEQATARFTDRLDYITGHSAKALAEGRMPLGPGEQMSANQQELAMRATKDFVREIPIGSFSPAMVAKIKSKAEERGIDTTNMDAMSLNDLGDVAGDIAGDMAKDFADKVKSNNPAVFYGVLGAGAVAVGAYGVTQGSKALKDLGIRPEIKTDLFNDRITAKVKAQWDPGLKNPVLGLYGQSNFDLGNNRRLSVGGGVVGAMGDKTASGGAEVIGTEAEIRYTQPGMSLYAKGYFNSSDHLVGVDPGRRQRINLSGHEPQRMRSAFDGGHQSHVQLGGSLRGKNWQANGFVQKNLTTDDFQAGLSAGYQPNDNVNIHLMGNYNSHTKSGQVGVGVRVRF